MLRTGRSSSIRGPNRGRHAPTIPSEDSTIGQYTVGVKRSRHSPNGKPTPNSCRACGPCIHVKSSSPESDSLGWTWSVALHVLDKVTEKKLTGGNLVENHEICKARRNGPFVHKRQRPGHVRGKAYRAPSRNMPLTPTFCFAGNRSAQT